MQILVMGVSGAGKSLIGQLLAARLGLPFIDADAFHSGANIAKMARGEPLTDEDRTPWLIALHAAILRHEPGGAVLACSALRQRYRDAILEGLTEPRVIFLKGATELIRTRLETREDHFMPPKLLASQLEALEPPHGEGVFAVDAAFPPAAIVEEIAARLAATNDR